MTIKVRAPVNDGTIAWIKLYKCEHELRECKRTIAKASYCKSNRFR